MTAEEFAHGYAWLYQRLFSHASIWRRRPRDRAAVAPYLAMSYLYKRSNVVWRILIRCGLTHLAWRPIVEWTRRRHVRFRARLAARPMELAPAAGRPASSGSVVSAGV